MPSILLVLSAPWRLCVKAQTSDAFLVSLGADLFCSVFFPEHGHPRKDGGPPGGRWRARMKHLLKDSESRKRSRYTQRWR